MEFVKMGKNYLIKGSNGKVVSEKEKLQLENREMVLKDIKSNDCQKETTKKISKNKKKIKKIEKEEKKIEEKEYKNPYISNSTVKDELYEDEEGNKILKRTVEINEETAQDKGESADDTIKETDNII